MDLAQNLQLDVDTVVGQQIAVFGLPGSGKTNFGALFCEQLGQFLTPMAIFDKESDWTSITSALPRGIVATRENCPTGYDILELGLQVVYDLASWEDQELAAQVILTTVEQMMQWSEARPSHERVPALIVLDESARWLPQKRGTFLSEETYKALHTCFASLSSTGRKRGLTPMYLNPKMSELNKDVLLPGMHVFFKATSHTDLDVCLEYIHSGDLTTAQLKNRIRALTPGKAIVRLPSGAQKLVTFHRRKSEHVSHTPGIQAAINRYERIPFNPEQKFTSTVKKPISLVKPEASETKKEPVKRAAKRAKREKKPVSARARCKILLKKNPDMSPAELAAVIGCSKVTTTQYRRELGYEPAPRTPVQSVVKQRIVTLLSETPDIKLYDLARSAHCSYGEAKKYRAEIEQASHE